ncbi:MAG: CDP-diacylglycerol--serine O-phosphatidyltransferase [Candidatus Latescibacteria bacterium]|jgi:CDP-diacylglycerol---serine O-phosphatidyltransferase|nr:CDP-diacylglycerol--serine O-phosphatidyltransferase [Candidatus Latescibacterota bacterium]
MKPYQIIKVFPGIFTLGNLFCGFLAVTNAAGGMYVKAAWWIIIAGVLDALDGKIARLTDSASEFGIQFDSIADVVSFGVAPAVLFYFYILSEAGGLGYILAFAYLASGAVRLARFNTHATTVKKRNFSGMPIPSGGGIIASYILFSENVWAGIGNFDIAVVIILLASMAMVSNFKYSLMPKIGFSTSRDILRSVWFISHILLIIRFPDEVFFPTGILYLFSGPAKYITAPAFEHVFHKVNSR